ncbi:MAG: radical SAM protein [bacterium]|nr:radical SAM protein [bacterium]
MRVLLVSMPDMAHSIGCCMRLPSGALASLAGNLPGHDVRVLDLVGRPRRAHALLIEALRTFQPHVLGLTAMTFQFSSLLDLARGARIEMPAVKIVAGGFHVSLLADNFAVEYPDTPLDFIVRGEGEATLRELLTVLDAGTRDVSSVPGLSWRDAGVWRHNPARPLLALDEIALPRRAARLVTRFPSIGGLCDTMETSRGCVHACTFCSIHAMSGAHYRTFPIARIVEDLRDLRARGAKFIMLTDDNLACDPDHWRAVCETICRHNFTTMRFIVQVGAAPLAAHPDIVALMARANMRIVFVGMESMRHARLATAHKPATPDINRRAIENLQRNGIAVIAGLIAGFPDDTRETIRADAAAVRHLRPDAFSMQIMTPFPGTRVRGELLRQQLVCNFDYDHYDGAHANVRTHTLSQTALQRCVTRATFRAILSPAFMLRNRLLHMMPYGVVRAQLTSFFYDIGKLLFGDHWGTRYSPRHPVTTANASRAA